MKTILHFGNGKAIANRPYFTESFKVDYFFITGDLHIASYSIKVGKDIKNLQQIISINDKVIAKQGQFGQTIQYNK